MLEETIDIKMEDDDEYSKDSRDSKRYNWRSGATKRLIDAYKECRELWDIKNAYHKNREARSVKVEYIARKFGTSPEEITRKLHNLRSQFNMEVRKIRKKHKGCGQNMQGLSNWEYYDKLLFLLRDPEPGLEDSREEVPMENVTVGLEGFQADEEMEFDIKSRCQSDQGRRSQTQVARPPVNTVYWPETPQMDKQGTDDCQIFGDFVASELRSLRSNESRKRLKRMIQKSILQVAEQEEGSDSG